MAFSDLVTHAASDRGVTQITPFSKGLSLFAHNFSPDTSTQYAGVKIPVYDLTAKAGAQKNSWYNLDDINGKVLNLENRAVAGISLDDTGVGTPGADGWGETSLTVAKVIGDATVAIAKALETQIATEVYGKMTEANVAETVTLSSDTKLTDFTKLVAGVAKTIDPSQCTLVLNPDEFYALYAVLPSNVIYQQKDPIDMGILRNVLGLKAVVLATKLPVATKGAFIADGAFGVVTRVNKPTIGGYYDTFTITGEDGFTIGYRAYEDLRDGCLKFAGDVLFGSDFLQLDEESKAKGVVLVK